MEKLFAAVRNQYSDYDVVDFRLLANQNEAEGQDVDQLDIDFAESVKIAVEVSAEDLATV